MVAQVQSIEECVEAIKNGYPLMRFYQAHELSENMIGDCVSMITKTCYLCVGPPGSGKSFLAYNNIAQHIPGTIICSADHYFMVDGQYKFDVTKLGSAHKQCQNLAEKAMMDGAPAVIIDNTNITPKERKPYEDLAKKYGYSVEYLIPKTPWAFNVDELVKRNTHGVPREAIERMLRRYVPPEG